MSLIKNWMFLIKSRLTRLPESSDPVIIAMRRLAARETAANRESFYRALKDSMLLLATVDDISENQKIQKAQKAQKAGKKKTGKAPETKSIAFKIVKDEDGATLLPVFTREEHFLKWHPDGSPFVGLSGTTALELLLKENADLLAINPAGPIWGTLSRAQVADALALD